MSAIFVAVFEDADYQPTKILQRTLDVLEEQRISLPVCAVGTAQ